MRNQSVFCQAKYRKWMPIDIINQKLTALSKELLKCARLFLFEALPDKVILSFTPNSSNNQYAPLRGVIHCLAATGTFIPSSCTISIKCRAFSDYIFCIMSFFFFSNSTAFSIMDSETGTMSISTNFVHEKLNFRPLLHSVHSLRQCCA